MLGLEVLVGPRNDGIAEVRVEQVTKWLAICYALNV